jgi:hypothetical protein
MLSQLWSKLSRKKLTADITSPESFERPAAENVSVPLGTEKQLELGKSGITFAVDSVMPAAKTIWTETLADSLARRLQRKILVLPENQQHVINARFDSLKEQQRTRVDVRNIGSQCHPLIDAVHVAFSQHRPLTLSPDSIWLVIAQGFGHHVAENAEALRHRLVRHEGRRELTVEADDLTSTSFEHAMASFSSQIRQATDPVLHETLICDFSTTSPAVRTASEVALMDSFSRYFTYFMGCICGIPKITIQGTADDWQRVRARVEVIATYGLEWWVSRLRPILDEFVLAADGHPTEGFWKAIYKPVQLTATRWPQAGSRTFSPTWVMLPVVAGITCSNTNVTIGPSPSRRVSRRRAYFSTLRARRVSASEASPPAFPVRRLRCRSKTGHTLTWTSLPVSWPCNRTRLT